MNTKNDWSAKADAWFNKHMEKVFAAAFSGLSIAIVGYFIPNMIAKYILFACGITVLALALIAIVISVEAMIAEDRKLIRERTK